MLSRQLAIGLPAGMADELIAAHNAYRDVMDELFEGPEGFQTAGDTELWKTVVDSELRMAAVCADVSDHLGNEQDPLGAVFELAAHVLAVRADVGGSFVRADVALSAEREMAMGRQR